MNRVRLPALVPDAARAQHDVVLRVLLRGRLGIVKAVLEALPFQRPLGVALDFRRQFDAQAVVDRGHDVAAVRVLVAHLTLGLDALGPVHHHRVADAAVPRVALPQLERRVERHRPAGRIVVVGFLRPELVELLQVIFHAVRDAVEEVVLVDGTVGAAFARRAVVRDDHDDRVVELAGFFQIVNQPPDLMIGVAAEARIHLGHARKELLLAVRQRIPRAHDIER